MKTVVLACGLVSVVCVLLLVLYSTVNSDAIKSNQELPTNKESSHQSSHACQHDMVTEELKYFHRSIAIIYDYSSISPQQLKDDITVLLHNVNQQLVAEIILVENLCEDTETSAIAVEMAKERENMKVVVVEADEQVSSGRARITAVSKTTAAFYFFVSAGNMPDSEGFLENMLYMVRKHPDRVVVPSRKEIIIGYHYMSWSMQLSRRVMPDEMKKIKPTQLPVIDYTAFFIRSDLYKAVGGYDEFFFKNDGADGLALSLAMWLCGGTIVRSDCAHVQSKLVGREDTVSVTYLQHAKYIQQVFGGKLVDQFNYPGIEFYSPSPYDLHAMATRKEIFKTKGCMTIEWYAHRFNDSMPIKPPSSRFYNQNYKPVLPLYEPKPKQIGKWLVLFAGYCVKVSEDNVLGLSWCPQSLTDEYLFQWNENGQIRTKANKCVTSPSEGTDLVSADCKADVDATQQFTFDKNKKSVIAKHNGQCITHFNGENSRQVLRPAACDNNSPFNKFVINDDY